MMTYDDSIHSFDDDTPYDHWDSVFLEVCYFCDLAIIERLLEGR